MEHTEVARDRDVGITTRTATRLAWSSWVLCVTLVAFALLFASVTDHVTQDAAFFRPGERPDWGTAVLMGVLSLAYPTVGALIASRLPNNPIGWIFCGMGLSYAMSGLTIAYADYVLLENFTLPGGIM